MKSLVYYVLAVIVFILVGWFANTAWHLPRGSNPISEIKPRPLDKYTIENLSKIDTKQVPIEQINTIKEYPSFISYEFGISFDPTLRNGSSKKVTGMLNIPKGDGPFPVIIMFRGFLDAETYFIGEGTIRAAEFFAKNGFITIAPDFLGYGNSDSQPNDTFESRFQTYTTALTLAKSISSIKEWDGKNLFIWGHSNGGQIALTILEITGSPIPTVLWAPVSKPFPYSILYFTDSPGDYGKSLRKALASFEADYDTDLYSIHKYFDRIKAPIQLNQGSADENVPIAWSDLLNTELKSLDVKIEYLIYRGNDHNMRPAWQSVVENNLRFFKSNLQ